MLAFRKIVESGLFLGLGLGSEHLNFSKKGFTNRIVRIVFGTSLWSLWISNLM